MSTMEEAAPVNDQLSVRGRKIYEEQLQPRLEPEHTGHFVAIEPQTGRYFLGHTGAEALIAAHQALPEHRFYLKRIGYDTTYRIGGYASHHR